MLNLTALKKNKLNTSALNPSSQFTERRKLGEELTQAPPQTLMQKIGSYIPSALKEPFVGTGQTVDLAGQTVFDTGLIGMFRPFGIGKSTTEKASDRSALLSPLVDRGVITQERMDEIIRDVVKPQGIQAVAQGIDPKKTELTRPEKIALRPVRIEEALDQVFGALDVLSLGTMKPISRTVAGKIATSKSADGISLLLKKELPEISDEASKVFGKALVEIDDVNDVQKVLNRTELALQEMGKKAGKVDTKALTGGKPVGFGEKQIQRTDYLPPEKIDEMIKSGSVLNRTPEEIDILNIKLDNRIIQLKKDIKKYEKTLNEQIALREKMVKLGREDELALDSLNSWKKAISENKTELKFTENIKTELNKPKPTTQPTLIQEAKKAIAEGKSADEFIKAQEVLYHGGESNISEFKPYNVYSGKDAKGNIISNVDGVYFTNSKVEAGKFGQNINNGIIDKNAKIKKVDLRTSDARTAVLMGVDYKKKILIEIKKAKDEGFQGVEIKRSSPTAGTDVTVQKMQKELNSLRVEYEKAMSKVNDDVLSKNVTKENMEELYRKSELKYPVVEKYRKLSNELNPTHTIIFDKDIIKTKSQLKEIYNKAKGVTSKETPRKTEQTKVTEQSATPTKQESFLSKNSLTNDIQQKVQTVKEIKKGLDPAEVKEIKAIPEKTVGVMARQEIEPKFLTPNEVEYLNQKRVELNFVEEQIEQHPAKPLKKYFNKVTGELPEVTGKEIPITKKRKTKAQQMQEIFARDGDEITSQKGHGYETAEDARADIHNLIRLEERVKDLKTEIKELAIIEKQEIALNKFLNKHPIKVGKTKVILEDKLTTRKIKQRPHYQSFVKYAEKYITRDIHPPILDRHITLTAERVAEYLDEGIGGRVYREIVKPVYKSAVDMTKELATIKNEVKSFKVIEGSVNDRDASLFAQKKLDTASDKAKDLAKYSRDKYDQLLVRMNEIRAKIGVEPIPKRQDYITHINEINVLTELLGGVDRITVRDRISRLKNEMLDRDANLSPTVAYERAKREVEGTTGIGMYVDARQPIFKYAKRRLGEYEKNPSVVRSLNAYSRSAMRYIYQAENVAKNKAYKDVLPANAKEFFRMWNTEQVAGRTPSSILNPVTKRMLSAVKGTLGTNTILGNLGTTVMQLTSFPQVATLAGPRNTMYGIVTRLSSYLSKTPSKYSLSRTKTLRDLDIDFGMGSSLIDSLLVKVGEIEKVRNLSAGTRLSIDFGRKMLMGIMQTADQFTVGSSFEAFYRKAILDGNSPEKALEYADMLTGKTQANYYKEALPPFLNTFGGKTIGQFGTYSFNQWEMFRKDFGKEFKLDKKSPKETKLLFKHFIYTLVGAYLIDMISEDVFGRQPYDIKDLVDEGIAMTQGKTDVGHLVEQGKETVMSYIPFMSSVKYGSMPPLLDFGSDIIQFTLGSDPMKVAKAKKDLEEKWALSVLLPYGGNQVRKTLQGIEFEDENNIEKVKALLFGKWATNQGLQYFEDIKQAEITKSKIKNAIKDEDYSKLSTEDKESTTTRNEIRSKYSIIGNISDDTNIEILNSLPEETKNILIGTYATSTRRTLERNLKTPTKTNTNQTLEGKKQLFREKIKKALENGTMTQEEALKKTQEFKQAIENLSK